MARLAIFAQSVGGGGGVAGNVDRGMATSMTEAGVTIPGVNIGVGLAFGQNGGGGGNGGDVLVSSTGTIYTSGVGSDGIFAQSVGGGGGVAGNIGNTIGGTTLLGWTGSVGDAGNGGSVTVDHVGSIIVTGDYSTGIYAQSAAGAGTAGNVAVTIDGSDRALGLDGVGIFAQSVGFTAPICTPLICPPPFSGNGNIDVTVAQGGVVEGGSGADAAGILLNGGYNNLIVNHGDDRDAERRLRYGDPRHRRR